MSECSWASQIAHISSWVARVLPPPALAFNLLFYGLPFPSSWQLPTAQKLRFTFSSPPPAPHRTLYSADPQIITISPSAFATTSRHLSSIMSSAASLDRLLSLDCTIGSLLTTFPHSRREVRILTVGKHLSHRSTQWFPDDVIGRNYSSHPCKTRSLLVSVPSPGATSLPVLKCSSSLVLLSMAFGPLS